VTAPAHAFVGYSADGTPMLLLVDDGTRETRRAAHGVMHAGGRIERMPIEDARKVRLYERPTP
jgi:hypothetical protein